MKLTLPHTITLVLTIVAAALAPVQQYAITAPTWVHVLLLSVFAVLAALGIPNLAQLASAPSAPAATPAPATAPNPPAAAAPAPAAEVGH